MSNTVTQLNQSFFHPKNFQLTFERIANTIFYCTTSNLPGVRIPALKQPTPLIDLRLPGNKMEFEPLVITYNIDDQFNTWISLYDWMWSVSGNTTNNYADLKTTATNSRGNQLWSVRPPYSDAILTIMTPKNNPLMRFTFHNCFPVEISPLEFNTGRSADEQLTGQATFVYDYYHPEGYG